MSKAYRNRADSDDSGDETLLPLAKDDDDYEPKLKRESVWTDVAVDQSLNAKSSRITLEKTPKFQRVSRGAESYDVPADVAPPQEEKKDMEMPVVAVTPANDDPFGDPVDFCSVEGFGTAPSSSSNRGRGRGGFQRGRGRGSGPKPQTQDEAMDDGSPKAQEAQPEEQKKDRGWMRGRGRGQYWQNRGGFRGRGGPQGMKRNWQGGWSDPMKMIAPEYSLEALMAVEFAQGISLAQLGQEIATALGEKDPATVLRIVEAVGEQKSLQLFDETREIETKGGMKILDGSRRRTPGGVFISLLKTDVDISPELKDKIFEASREEFRRNFKKAKRRGHFEDKIKQVSEMLEKEKTKDADLKELPDVSEVVQPEVPPPETSAAEGMES